MIHSIHLASLRNAEYLQFITDIVTLIQKHDPATLLIQLSFQELQAKQQELSTLFKKQQSSELTEEIELLDKERDQALKGIFAIIKGYVHHYDAKVQSASEVLQEHLKHYGNQIIRQSYQAETATVHNIISGWEENETLSQALASLNLTTWKDHLKEKNTQFSQKYIDRTQEYGQASPENIKTKRNETNAVYYQLKKIAEAHAVITPNAAYENLFNDLNALITQYNHVLKLRQTRE